jgi:DNA-directed RNA polymerase specialized sigma24 family protein
MHLDLSDSDLIIRSVNQPRAFTELSARHGAAVRDYLGKRTGRATADRLTLATFSLAFRHRERHQPRSDNARSWFLGIATDLLNRDTKRRVPWSYEATERLAERRDPSLTRALAGLGERDTDLVCLKTLGGLTSIEVARAVGTSADRVENRLRVLEPHVGGVSSRLHG